jgi:hypothetical protein
MDSLFFYGACQTFKALQIGVMLSLIPAPDHTGAVPWDDAPAAMLPWKG